MRLIDADELIKKLKVGSFDGNWIRDLGQLKLDIRVIQNMPTIERCIGDNMLIQNIPGNTLDLCSSCKHSVIWSDYNNDDHVECIEYSCHKWRSIVDHVGVCKYYEKRCNND